VLASAVNRPIILLEGSERLNAVRSDRWRYLTEVRARTCAEKLIVNEDEQKQVLFDLVAMAGGPPDPQIKPKLQEALDTFAQGLALPAQANPVARANVLLHSARYGIREEMKQRYGFAWREHVRGVTTTLDVPANLGFAQKMRAKLAEIDTRYGDRIDAAYTLDPAKISEERASPGVVVVAANADGEIVRYFEQGENASYYSSPFAREAATGYYDRRRESRMIASTGKIIAAIAIANTLRDTPHSTYTDSQAPAQGLETCARGEETHGRAAIVAFACSLNAPLLTRTARVGQARVQKIIDDLGFAMPPSDASGHGTPASTAAVLGQVAGAPRRVHHMASVVLASLTGRGAAALPAPSLIKRYDYTEIDEVTEPPPLSIVPDSIIRPGGRELVRTLLQAPLCYETGGKPAGTLKELSHWCTARRPGLALHFAKTGTQVTEDVDATVDAWITGGLRFGNGAGYSYVVVVGTGTPSQPWARKLHAAQVAVPLLETLLNDLEPRATASAPAKKKKVRDTLSAADRTLQAPTRE